MRRTVPEPLNARPGLRTLASAPRIIWTLKTSRVNGVRARRAEEIVRMVAISRPRQLEDVVPQLKKF